MKTHHQAVIESVWRRLPKPRKGVLAKPPLPFTTEEFRERIRAICGVPPGPIQAVCENAGRHYPPKMITINVLLSLSGLCLVYLTIDWIASEYRRAKEERQELEDFDNV